MAPQAGLTSTSAKSMQRAKFYLINDGKWRAQGIHRVTVDYLEGSEKVQGLYFYKEIDNDILLFQSIRINSDDIYRKPKDMMISWRNPKIKGEFALRFAEQIGCSYIWGLICDAQRKIRTGSALNTVSETWSEVQSNSACPLQESSSGIHLGLGTRNSSPSQSCSVVQPNFPSPLQEASLELDLCLGPRQGIGNNPLLQFGSPSLAPDHSLGLNLGLIPRLELEADSTSSFSVNNYLVHGRRSSVSSTSQHIANYSSDSDYSDINAMKQIFRRAKRKLGVFITD